MKHLNFLITTGVEAAGDETFYFPVPCKGTVNSLKVVFDTIIAVDDTVDIQRDGTSVNLATATVVTAGVIKKGTPDTTNKGLVFDPDSTTEAYKMLEIVISELETENTVVGITIEYDDSAYVKQAPSEE